MASSDDRRRSVEDGSSVLALIDDYRAQQEAWRAKAHDLARMREALRSAADREARAIVSAAQRDVDEVLRRANEALVALNNQVRALSEAADSSLPAEQAGVKFGRRAGDLQQVAAIVKGAAQELADVNESTRARLGALVDAAAVEEATRDEATKEAAPAARSVDRAAGGDDRASQSRSIEVTAAQAIPLPPSTTVEGVESRREPPGTTGPRLEALTAPPVGPVVVDPLDALDALDAFPPSMPMPAPIDVEPSRHVDAGPATADITPSRGLPSSLRTFIAAFTVLGAVILAATAWWVWHSRAQDLVAADRTTTSPPAASSAESSRGATPATAPAGTPSASAPDAGTPGSASPAAGAAETNPPSTAAPSGLSVQVEAVRAAWLRVTVDDQVVAAREFQVGETQEFKGGREVQIRAGDAGAVRVSVGGAQPAPLGRDGQTITRRFTVDEPVAPAASASPAAVTPPTSVGTNGPAPATPVPRSDTLGAGGGSGLVDADRSVVPASGMVQPPAAASSAATPVPAAAPAPRTASPTGMAGIPASGPAGSAAGGESVTHNALETQFVRAVTRWFDAYQRQDRAGMAAFSSGPPSVSDERTESERAPRAAGNVRRAFEDVRLQLVTENAVFTTKMTERFDDPATGRSNQWDSFVSQLWTLRAGVWQLEDVRVVPTSKLRQNFR